MFEQVVKHLWSRVEVPPKTFGDVYFYKLKAWAHGIKALQTIILSGKLTTGNVKNCDAFTAKNLTILKCDHTHSSDAKLDENVNIVNTLLKRLSIESLSKSL